MGIIWVMRIVSLFSSEASPTIFLLFKFTSLLLFIYLEIASLYGLLPQKNLHLHDQMLGWLRRCDSYVIITYVIILMDKNCGGFFQRVAVQTI